MIANVGTHKPVEERQWPYPCLSRVLEDSYRIEFPASTVLGKIPKGVTYQEAGIHYHSTYEKQGHSVVVHRILEVQHQSDVCTPQDNEAWKVFHAVLQRDLRSQVFYQ